MAEVGYELHDFYDVARVAVKFFSYILFLSVCSRELYGLHKNSIP